MSLETFKSKIDKALQEICKATEICTTDENEIFANTLISIANHMLDDINKNTKEKVI